LHLLISGQDPGTVDLEHSTDIITVLSEFRGTNSKYL